MPQSATTRTAYAIQTVHVARSAPRSVATHQQQPPPRYDEYQLGSYTDRVVDDGTMLACRLRRPAHLSGGEAHAWTSPPIVATGNSE